jgi:hypothetical protein
MICQVKQKPLSEDFWAIGYDGRRSQITINNDFVFEAPKLKCIIFLYHDSLFMVKNDQDDNPQISLLINNKREKDSLKSLFESYQKTSLHGQLKEIEAHGMPLGCFTDGYFLFRKHDQIQFGLFNFMRYYEWMLQYHPKEIPLSLEKLPRIYPVIYHTFNSKWWDYYMSDTYHFKDLRIHYSSSLQMN